MGDNGGRRRGLIIRAFMYAQGERGPRDGFQCCGCIVATGSTRGSERVVLFGLRSARWPGRAGTSHFFGAGALLVAWPPCLWSNVYGLWSLSIARFQFYRSVRWCLSVYEK